MAEPWRSLGKPLPVDVANTLRRTGAVYRDLWQTGADVAAWARLESGRVPPVEAADAQGRLPDLRRVRDDVFAVLLAVTVGRPCPPDVAGRMNELARSHAVVDQLGDAIGTLHPDVVGSHQGVDRLVALVVHATIAFTAHPDAARLALCDAPSCGQFFLRGRPNQLWCGSACGTRARVARHAAAAG
jgi:predicted RNA-binding Zn ribbon-like protein